MYPVFGRMKSGGGAKKKARWVFGLYQSPNKTRFFLVTKLDAGTLLPLIEKTCAPGSVIHSDGWKAYGGLSDRGFTHFVVNHS
jgi:transposase